MAGERADVRAPGGRAWILALRAAVAGLILLSGVMAWIDIDTSRRLGSSGPVVQVGSVGDPTRTASAAPAAAIPRSTTEAEAPSTSSPLIEVANNAQRRVLGAQEPMVPVPSPAPAQAEAVTPQPEEVPSGLQPYHGLGTWVDVYDWSQTYTREGEPQVGVRQIDEMADVGMQTLYLQASKHDAPTDVLEPERLDSLIDRAHAHGIKVVAWYLPTFVDPAADMRRLLAISSLEIDGIGVDIEARNVTDVNERNRRLIQLSADLRSALPTWTIGGIVLPPVLMEEVNRKYWPNFPWRQIEPYYDVWQTMGYWTDRKASSGWRNAHDYTVENVVRLRRNLGDPNANVHAAGGIGHKSTRADYEGFLRASRETFCLGGSIYDWRTTRPDAYETLRGFRT